VIRTTYKGREIKVLATRKSGFVRTLVNGHPVNHGFAGTDLHAADVLRLIIDRIDANGPGNNPTYTSPFWYEPGTYGLNGFGHVIAMDGGGCLCDLCLMCPAQNVPAEVTT
jgi:hypothetical protein